MSIESPKLKVVLEALPIVLAVIIFVWWAAIWVLHLLGIAYSKWKFYQRKFIAINENLLPGVSILKPLLGVDSNLEENIKSFFNLKYPKSYDDPALILVQDLISIYPHIDSKIFIGGENVGLNPKINNLMPGYRAAKHELILISDAGMKMKEDTLSDMVSAMTEKVGVVTQMPFTCDRPGFGAALEKVYFGTGHCRLYMTAHFFHLVCTTGMSSLMRKSALDDIGGMQAFGIYLAEDYFIGKLLHTRGWKCAVASQPGWQNHGNCQVKKLNNRLCRWAKLRISMLPQTAILEPLQDCFLLGLMASWAAYFLFEFSPLYTIPFFFGHVLIWMILDYIILCVVQHGLFPCNPFYFVSSWFYLQISAIPIILCALFNPYVKWKAGTFRLKMGGLIEKVEKKCKDSEDDRTPMFV